jgi:hypothetical protein
MGPHTTNPYLIFPERVIIPTAYPLCATSVRLSHNLLHLCPSCLHPWRNRFLNLSFFTFHPPFCCAVLRGVAFTTYLSCDLPRFARPASRSLDASLTDEARVSIMLVPPSRRIIAGKIRNNFGWTEVARLSYFALLVGSCWNSVTGTRGEYRLMKARKLLIAVCRSDRKSLFYPHGEKGAER